MKNFYVEGPASWFVVRCRTKRKAKSEGVREYGRGGVVSVQPAGRVVVDDYKHTAGVKEIEVIE